MFGLAGRDTFDATAGTDTFDGGLDADVIDYSQLAGANFITVTLAGENDATVFVDGSDNDTIRNIEGVIGTDGDDSLTGDAENNTLSGGAGDDVIRGGRGSDILSGGDGFDALRFDELTVLGVELNLATGSASFGGDGSTDTFSGFEEYYTSNQDDIVRGSADADVVFGLSGDDTFEASAGTDQFDGGLGSDTVDYSTFPDANFITLTLDLGNLATVNVDGSDADQIRNIENVVATSGDDTVTGDDADNAI